MSLFIKFKKNANMIMLQDTFSFTALLQSDIIYKVKKSKKYKKSTTAQNDTEKV